MSALDITPAGSAGYLISPESMVLLVVGVTFVLPFAKWAGERLWEGLTGRQKKETAQLEALAVEVRSGFQAIRDLIGAHQADLREFGVRVQHLETEVTRLREDRNELASQLQAVILSARKGA